MKHRRAGNVGREGLVLWVSFSKPQSSLSILTFVSAGSGPLSTYSLLLQSEDLFTLHQIKVCYRTNLICDVPRLSITEIAPKSSDVLMCELKSYPEV